MALIKVEKQCFSCKGMGKYESFWTEHTSGASTKYSGGFKECMTCSATGKLTKVYEITDADCNICGGTGKKLTLPDGMRPMQRLGKFGGVVSKEEIVQAKLSHGYKYTECSSCYGEGKHLVSKKIENGGIGFLESIFPAKGTRIVYEKSNN